jgi:hypothetical protein
MADLGLSLDLHTDVAVNAAFPAALAGMAPGLPKERSAMLKIAPLRKKRYPARGARKKQFPINIKGKLG